MPVLLGRNQLSRFFLSSSLEAFLVLNDQPKVKYSLRLHLNVKKLASASQGYHGRKNVNRYERAKKLQIASHWWVRMQIGFSRMIMVEKMLIRPKGNFFHAAGEKFC